MQFFKDILYLFFPEACQLCNKPLATNEKHICVQCSFDLPITNFTEEANNLIEQSFYGRVTIEFASCLFYYGRKSVIQQLVHKLKYKNEEQLGVFFGQWLGSEFAESKRFPDIDIVVPVPIHKKKLKTRGYNQVTKFSQEIAKSINADYNEENLICISDVATQTYKSRADRWKNVKEKFSLKNVHLFENKSILLVDDVITTGATIEACALQLQKTNNIKISVATIAFTS